MGRGRKPDNSPPPLNAIGRRGAAGGLGPGALGAGRRSLASPGMERMGGSLPPPRLPPADRRAPALLRAGRPRAQAGLPRRVDRLGGAEVPQASQAGGAECALPAVSLGRREKPGFARAGPGGAAGRRRLAAAAPLPAGPAGNLCRQRALRGNLLPGGGLAVRRQGAGPQPGGDAQGGVRATAAPALAAGPAARAAGPRPQEVGRARRRRRRARPSARQRRSASCRCGRACWPTWCA